MGVLGSTGQGDDQFTTRRHIMDELAGFVERNQRELTGPIGEVKAEMADYPPTLMELLVDVLGGIDRINRTLGLQDGPNLQTTLSSCLGDGSCGTLEATVDAASEAARMARAALGDLDRTLEAICQKAGRVQYAEAAAEGLRNG